MFRSAHNMSFLRLVCSAGSCSVIDNQSQNKLEKYTKNTESQPQMG